MKKLFCVGALAPCGAALPSRARQSSASASAATEILYRDRGDYFIAPSGGALVLEHVAATSGCV